MSQSLYTAMGGINAATTQIQVVSNNVANIDTTAFKASSVNFEDVYSTTISSGSVATSSSGGTNPIQEGVGTKVSSISKDFNAGSSVATGTSTDLMIKGSSGFFTVTDGSSTYYTRAGNFSFDASGNLVTSNGYQVEGTDSIMSSTTSGKTVSIPLTICADVEGTKAATLGAEKLTDLNGLGTKTNVTSGDFSMSVTIGGVVYTGTVSALSGLTTDSTVNDVVNYLNGAGGLNFTSTTSPAASTTTDTTTAAAGDKYVTAGATAGDSISTTTTTAAGSTLSGIKAKVIDGKIQIDASDVSITRNVTTAVTDTTKSTSLASLNTTSVPTTTTGAAATAIAYSTTGLAKATNFVSATGLSSATLKGGITETNTLDSTAGISELSTATNSISKTGITINSDGSIQVTYNDGSVLAVQLNADSSNYSFVYTTADHVQISGTKCGVDANVATPANFVVQMANVTNVDGLLSTGSNLFESGPNSGDVVYTTAGQMGAGQVESGYLEASNVDLSKELSNMILAQRAIQANSRVFTTTSSIMQTITQMGQ